MTVFLQVCAALGGLTFVATTIRALAAWRTSKASAGKTGADTITALTDNALKAANAAIERLEKQAGDLTDELEKTRGKLQAVLEHMQTLEGLLRQAGVQDVPRLVWPGTRNRR